MTTDSSEVKTPTSMICPWCGRLYSFAERMKCPECKTVSRSVLCYSEVYKRHYFAAVMTTDGWRTWKARGPQRS